MKQLKKLTIEQMKKIAHKVIEAEAEKEQVEVNIFPITFIEYYNDSISTIFKDKVKLSNLSNILTKPLYADGFNLNQENIVVFLSRVKKLEKIDNQLSRLLEICYHEIYHTIQKKIDDYSYRGFLLDIDDFIHFYHKKDYRQYHDNYSNEIGANLYAISKTKEYLQKNHPNYYTELKDDLEKKEQQYRFDYLLYDASDTIERMINRIKKILKENDCQAISNLDDISPILKIFINKNISFKTLDEIMKHEKFQILDKRIVYAFLSCKSFLKTINIENLTEEELTLLNESLQYTNLLYQKQQKILEEKSEKNTNDLKEYLISQKSILKKIKYLKNFLNKLIIEEFKSTRNEYEIQKHINSIPNYLEKTNNQIKKRSKGYMTFNICYIMSIIISILTVLYLIIK